MKTNRLLLPAILITFSLTCSMPGVYTAALNSENNNATDSMEDNAVAVTQNTEATEMEFPAKEEVSEEIAESYYLYSPLKSTETYLMKTDGTTVFTWQSAYTPGNAVYLLNNGNILRTGNIRSEVFDAGGAGGIVQEIAPDSSIVWEYKYANAQVQLHHDIAQLPNGNILMIAWELKTEAEAIAAGRNPDLLGAGELWPDHVIEVNPATKQIVWEWHVWDHLVQEYDASKSNYGVVAEEPGLINLNFTARQASADWTHINAIDYNAALDQILLSVHGFNEVWIIDHSISSEEAAGTAGNLLYRWGNPQAYGAGSAEDQQFFGQHNAQWILNGYPGADNILVFNNGNKRIRKYSSVDEIVPPLNADGSYSMDSGIVFGPDAPIWSYTAEIRNDFYADSISSAQRLSNGNTLICNGPAGLFFEVTTYGETVWQYDYGSPVFRVTAISADHPALSELDLSVPVASASADHSFNLDTGQTNCYDNQGIIPCPEEGESFYGQDAQYESSQPSYVDNGDGTVTDLNSGLMWMQDPGEKMEYYEAIAYAGSFTFAGYDDWRVPTVKELYSLMNFSGIDDAVTGTDPFIDRDYFVFEYGDPAIGEREIDSQWVTTSIYKASVMDGQECFFGVNFADGRIKCYPTHGRKNKLYFLRFVRGEASYGENQFVDNSDGTISDFSTDLVWQQADSTKGLDWGDALSYCENLELAGQDDWRLPNAKELQYIVDYDRNPDTTNSAAIDSLFTVSNILNEAGQADYPFYWTGTTHATARGGQNAAYVSFGRAMGNMNDTWMDVHGAGAQRSDPKSGNPADFPNSLGPQGDARRLLNYARCVRGGL